MNEKQRLRAAQLILQQLAMHRRRAITTAFDRLRTPACSAGDFHQLARQCEKAVALKRDSAARQLMTRIGRSVFSLQRQLYDLASLLSEREPPMPLLREVWEDLEQLESEFSPCEFVPNEASLKVTTDEITLEGTYLGTFQIVLDLSLLNRLDRRPYRVIAVDPQPSQRDSDTVHPHISDERLCEGDAANTIRSCLQTGRIAEFFLIVRSVLQTYNAASAYVSLDDWDATSCRQCGGSMSSSESWVCERCRDEVCGDCIESCKSCDDHHCPQCTVKCSDCDEYVCRDCLQTCNACGRRSCAACLDEQLCGDCRERMDDEVLAVSAAQPADGPGPQDGAAPGAPASGISAPQ